MHKGRMEAFSDGVFAIIITIMVLELKVPHSADLHALAPILPVFLSYVLSFVFVGIYWNNHHHLLQAARDVEGATLWANLHLLFWLSLIPFVTSWMGETHFAKWPVTAYGTVLLLAAIAWSLLCRNLTTRRRSDSTLAVAVQGDIKAKASIALYVIAILMAFIHPLLACTIYCLVAALWFVPSRRIERMLALGEK